MIFDLEVFKLEIYRLKKSDGVQRETDDLKWIWLVDLEIILTEGMKVSRVELIFVIINFFKDYTKIVLISHGVFLLF